VLEALAGKRTIKEPTSALAGCEKTMSARENFDGSHVWDKSGLPGYLVCLVHLVSLIQPNKPDRPNRPNEQDRLADFFSILLP
jgi:hypothetical protein